MYNYFKLIIDCTWRMCYNIIKGATRFMNDNERLRTAEELIGLFNKYFEINLDERYQAISVGLKNNTGHVILITMPIDNDYQDFKQLLNLYRRT